MASGKKRITTNSASNDRLKKLIKLEKSYQEWKNDFTLDYCFTAFMVVQMERGNSSYTINNYNYFFRRYSAFLLETLNATPKELTVEIMETQPFNLVFTDWLKKQGLQQSSINAFMRCYRAFGKWCLEEGYLEDFKCSVKQDNTKVKEVYTTAELEKLLVKPPITDFHNFRSYCMISLMLNTGARRRTISNIKICDLEIEEGYINFNTTKTNKVVRLGLERKTKRDLLEWLNYWRLGKGAEPTDYLFCNEYGGQLTSNAITAAIAKYNRSRGVEKTSVHLFRHTFAKMWITSGGDIISLARVLTHSELEMVKRYSNLYGGDIKKEIEEHSAISQMKTRSGKTLKNQGGGKSA